MGDGRGWSVRVCVCVWRWPEVCVCVFLCNACVHVHEYNTLKKQRCCLQLMHAHYRCKTAAENTRRQADILIFLPICVTGVHDCVVLTWWPVRWRRAAFPAGRAGSLHSSSDVGASRRRSCHSSGTCRRKGRPQASERWTAGPPSHTQGSLSRSRWPGVSRGAMTGKRRWRTRNELLGEIKMEDAMRRVRSKVKTDEITRGEKMGWGCWEKKDWIRRGEQQSGREERMD